MHKNEVFLLWRKIISNRRSFDYFKLEQVLFQIGADLLFQNGADLLQIGAVISNRGNYFKSVQNNITLTYLEKLKVMLIYFATKK